MRLKCAISSLLSLLLVSLTNTLILHAEQPRNLQEYRARYSVDSADITSQAHPVKLAGGSTLTLISPKRWDSLANQLLQTLQIQHDYYSDLFGEVPPLTTTLVLMPDHEFYQQTGAPLWTNALFYRGRIIIPLSDTVISDTDNLIRSVKHEYTHAVVHALSGGRCPGWIDEGLAQWAEGYEHPALAPALMRWLSARDPVPLEFLQNGFTRLNSQIVAAAYAQSYFATRLLIAEHGFEALASYFSELRKGSANPQAFETAFAMSERQFERVLNNRLRTWQQVNSGVMQRISVTQQFFSID